MTVLSVSLNTIVQLDKTALPGAVMFLLIACTESNNSSFNRADCITATVTQHYDDDNGSYP